MSIDKGNEDIVLSNNPELEQNSIVQAIAQANATPDKLKWTRENITSIREATKTGRHDRLFYPASGFDILRTLFSFDATEVTAIDDEPKMLARITEQFKDAGIDLIQIPVDGSTTKLSCTITGRPRNIFLINKDARVALNELESKSTDILYIFAPSGARTDLELTEYQGTVKTIPAIHNSLTFENYSKVAVDGFLVFGEERLSPYEETPEPLLEIAGIEEVKITRRHPDDVLTTLHTSNEANSPNRDGYIYHKTKEVDVELIKDVVKAIEFSDATNYVFAELRRGGFSYIGINNQQTNLKEALTTFYRSQKSEMEAVTQSMLSHGAPQANVEKYLHHSQEQFTNNLKILQEQFRDFFIAYQRIVEKVSKKEIDTAQALKEFGVVQGKYGQESQIWPIALQYLRDANKEGRFTTDIVKQFIELDINSFTDEADNI